MDIGPERVARESERRRGTELATFYTSLRDSYSAYHTHKETLGWIAVAAYLALDVQVMLSSQSGVWQSAGVVVATLVLLSYTRRQFNLRLYAAQVNWAASRLAALAMAYALESPQLAPRSVREDAPQPARSKATRQNRWKTMFPDRLWKAFFPDPLKVGETNRDSLPRSVIDELNTKAGRETEARAEALEKGAYCLVIFACMATVLSLLVQ